MALKKTATFEEKTAAVAKALVKQLKSSDGKKCVSICHGFREVFDSKGSHTIFKADDGKKGIEVDFGSLSEEAFGKATCSIADTIANYLKPRLKKGEVIHRTVSEIRDRNSAWWNSRTYKVTKRLEVVHMCKEFLAINKKLKALGLSEINFKDWYIDYVSGKRSSIFSHDVSYYAEDKEKCKKVLEYLKGKKKVSYEFVNSDHLEDREYGERYETEWTGSMSKQLRFTDSRGQKCTIY